MTIYLEEQAEFSVEFSKSHLGNMTQQNTAEEIVEVISIEFRKMKDPNLASFFTNLMTGFFWNKKIFVYHILKSSN